MVSEQAGVLNLSLEGMMLTAAFMGALGAKLAGSPFVGLLLGVAAALLLAVGQALLSVRVRANQLVVGIGFNIFALGATTFLYRQIFGGLSREQIPSFGPLELPVLSRIPLLGPAVFSQAGLVYVAFALVIVTWYLMARTPFGLGIRAVGENPRAADQAGLNVGRIRFLGVLYAGGCAGLAGVFISVASISTFTEGMTNGAGYLAVTAVILGGWRSGGVVGACLLFGAATSLQFLLPAMGVPLPTAVLVMLPYVLALIAVSGIIRRSRPPAALTLPFRRGGH
jgi:simple sugar transport system permease protein